VRTLALAVAVLVFAGCGDEDKPYFAAGPPMDPNCQDAGRAGARVFRACYRPQLTGQPAPSAGERHGRLEVSEANGPWRRLKVPHPLGAKPGRPAAGHWDWAAVSPDGKWLLAQWTAECEVPVAFLVPARGGDAVPVARDRYGASTSKALGWTRDGRAIIELPGLSCGSTSQRPGTYVLRPGGKPVYWRPIDEVGRSTRARAGPG
jgi:hypothetical protein